jgi:hypothetical protein
MIPRISKSSYDPSAEKSNERYQLRSQGPISTPIPKPILVEDTTLSPKEKISKEEQRERFYWRIVCQLKKEHRSGALGRKWALKVHNAACDLQDENSSEFKTAYNKMSRLSLIRMIEQRIRASYIGV